MYTAGIGSIIFMTMPAIGMSAAVAVPAAQAAASIAMNRFMMSSLRRRMLRSRRRDKMAARP
ncbi:MAG: hypothetical protein WDN08_10135 [Rhizomicrobium sp.]